MPRIRTIKPEFWDSPGTASASLRIRLLFIAMWNWADDHGRGTANMNQLLAFAFPADAELPRLCTEAPRICAEVSDAFEVVWYEVAGRRYYEIPSWNRHQKNERKAQSKYPPPPDGLTCDDRPEWATVTKMRGTSATTHGSSGTGTGEQGNRGTGELCPPVFDVTHYRASARESSGGTRAEKRIATLNATSRSAEAQAFAEQFADWAGGIPAQSIIEIAHEIDPILGDGLDPTQIADGLKAWHSSDSWSATQIPGFVRKAAKPRTVTTKPTSKAQAADAVIEQLRQAIR